MTERVQTSGAPSRTFEVTIGGKYRIESLIGEGGFARVYKARHARIRQLVFAVKILRKQQVEDESQIERFVREAEMSATIQTPYAVRVTDFGETRQGLPYIVMEYVKGRTLHDWTRKFGTPDDRFAAQIALCILRALEEAHGRGIVHRDLKPSNIMILDEPSDDGIVAKVTDFGIAKVISSSQAGMEESPPTTGGLVFCTPQYASPEVLMGNPTFQSDLYALGHTLAEMLDGASPYAGWGSFEIANRQMAPEPTEFGVSTRRSALAPIIARACAKDLDHRYPDAATMARDVEKLLSRLDRTTAVDAPAVVEAESEPRALSDESAAEYDMSSAATLLTAGQPSSLPEWDPLDVAAPRPASRIQTTLQPTVGAAASAIDSPQTATRPTATRQQQRWNAYWIIGAAIASAIIIVAAILNTQKNTSPRPNTEAQEAQVAATVDELARRMDELERDRARLVDIQSTVAEARLATTMALQTARTSILTAESYAAMAESSSAGAALLTTLRSQEMATAIADHERALTDQRRTTPTRQRYQQTTTRNNEEQRSPSAERAQDQRRRAADEPAPVEPASNQVETDNSATSDDRQRRRRIRFPLVLE